MGSIKCAEDGGEQKKLSKMRAHCKSHTDDKARKRRVLSDENNCKSNTGPTSEQMLQHLQKEKEWRMGGRV